MAVNHLHQLVTLLQRHGVGQAPPSYLATVTRYSHGQATVKRGGQIETVASPVAYTVGQRVIVSGGRVAGLAPAVGSVIYVP
ncbi:MAG: hypothetical protein EPN21_08850 [Methylococcaceae bacterium]|nr:MAG: hypothetical protein EPN21_08850 [Methylococcaceae bacterium]